MSDFTSGFWSIYVAGITLAGIFGCLLLLWFSGKTEAMTATDNTTGHVWDGDLRELNNPLPRWWVGLFIITCLFSLAYLFLYPGLGTYGGKLAWSQVEQYKAEVAKGDAAIKPLYDRFNGMSTAQLAADKDAMQIGDRLFMNNCAQCHGSDARGGSGFPNLTDHDWLWGGSPEAIKETITNGRTGIMPAQAAAVGTPDDVLNVAHYVMSLSKSPHDEIAAAKGKAKFGVCAACHGADGKGNQALGAPNLTTGIFRYGVGIDAIVHQVNSGRTGHMPPQVSRLSPEQINILSAYVWGKSNAGNGGGAAPAAAASAPATAPVLADEASIKVENGIVSFYFATGKSDVAAGADTALAEIAAGVKAGKKAVISGFVDSTGNAAQNAELAKNRAAAVAAQLKALGVTDEQIDMQKPADIDAGTGAQARRVEVKLM